MCLYIDFIHIFQVFVLCNLCTCFVCLFALHCNYIMSIRYKLDVLEALKAVGYTTYRLRQEKLMGERVIQQIRDGTIVSWKTIDTICCLLNCQPGDIVEYINPDDR